MSKFLSFLGIGLLVFLNAQALKEIPLQNHHQTSLEISKNTYPL